jgi:hypothetical protein
LRSQYFLVSACGWRTEASVVDGSCKNSDRLFPVWCFGEE